MCERGVNWKTTLHDFHVRGCKGCTGLNGSWLAGISNLTGSSFRSILSVLFVFDYSSPLQFNSMFWEEGRRRRETGEGGEDVILLTVMVMLLSMLWKCNIDVYLVLFCSTVQISLRSPLSSDEIFSYLVFYHHNVRESGEIRKDIKEEKRQSCCLGLRCDKMSV